MKSTQSNSVNREIKTAIHQMQLQLTPPKLEEKALAGSV